MRYTDLAKIMDARGVKLRQLASALDAPESTVSRWRSGVKPSRHYRLELVRELSLTASEIKALGWDEQEAARV